MIGGLAPNLLRRHIAHGPQYRPRLGRCERRHARSVLVGCRRACSRGQAEIEDLHHPSRVTKTFAGFRSRWTIPLACADERPSAIAAPVSTASRHATQPRLSRRSATRPRAALLPRRPCCPPFRRRTVARMFGCDSNATVRASRSKRLERVGVACELLRKNFQRHVASEARVLGAVDLAHSAGSKGLDDAIGPKAGSWRERHGERSLAPVAQPVKTSGFRGGVDAPHVGAVIEMPAPQIRPSQSIWRCSIGSSGHLIRSSR